MYPNFVNQARIEEVRRLRNSTTNEKKSKIISHYLKQSNQEIDDIPTHAYIETISTCNYACGSCPQGNPELKQDYVDNLESSPVMSFENFEAWGNEIVSAGIKSISLYNTNEPLLDPLLFKRLRLLETMELDDVILMSNASLMTKDKVQLILASCVSKMCFSVDAASPKTYDVVRPEANKKSREVGLNSNEQIASRYEIVRDKIRDFCTLSRQERPDILTRASFVVSKQNFHEIDKFISEFREFIDVIEFQYNHVADFNRTTIDNEFTKLSVEDCSAPSTTIFIRPDGSIYPCCTVYSYISQSGLGETLKLGSLSKSSYKTILESKKRLTIMSALKNGTPIDRCNECLQNNYCHKTYSENNKYQNFSPLI